MIGELATPEAGLPVVWPASFAAGFEDLDAAVTARLGAAADGGAFAARGFRAGEDTRSDRVLAAPLAVLAAVVSFVVEDFAATADLAPAAAFVLAAAVFVDAALPEAAGAGVFGAAGDRAALTM